MKLEELLITEDDIDKIIHINVIKHIALAIYRFLVLGNRKLLLSLLLTEIFGITIILIFLLPINILIFKNNLTEINILLTSLIITFLILILSNFYLFNLGKHNHALAKLINKIEEYNQVIQTMIVVRKIEIAQTEKSAINQEILATLINIKENIINALKITQIVQPYQNLQLFIQLENSLLNLVSFETTIEGNEYQELLKNAVAIALTLHKEIRNMKQKE
jgi:hypothetical protein